MSSWRWIRVVLIWCVFLAPALLGQDPGCQRRVLPISVADRNGSPIRDLTVVDLQAEFRGKPVKIVSVTRDTRPRRVVILLDASGSMAGYEGEKPWNWALKLASHMAATRLQNTSVALLIFGDNIYEQHELSQGTEIIADRLRAIASDPQYAKKGIRGRTALFDTIMVALRLLAPPRSDDVIYAITDGGPDNKSRMDWDSVKHELLSSDVRLYASVISPDLEHGRTPEELNGASDIRRLADASGGLVFEPIRPSPVGFVRHELDDKERSVLNNNLVSLYRLMLENYVLEVELPAPVDKWRSWKLEISKEKRRQFKDAAVGYPRELGPCSQQLGIK